MEKLLSGNFYSDQKVQLQFNDLILTDSQYHVQKPIPWHYHENAYFSYVVNGHLLEISKKQTIACVPGTLIFNNTNDPHYNKGHSKHTRYFYIELKNKWLENHGVNKENFRTHPLINNPFLTTLIRKIYEEFKINDDASQLAIEGLLLTGLGYFTRHLKDENSKSPGWVQKIKEVIHDNQHEKVTLKLLSDHSGVHPIYISQNFHKYFKTSLSGYLRKVRVENSLVHLANKDLSLSQIAVHCGFSDQSHFTRCFKEINGITPFQYRQIIGKS